MDNGQSHHNVGQGEYKVHFHNGIDLHSKARSNPLGHVDRFFHIRLFNFFKIIIEDDKGQRGDTT